MDTGNSRIKALQERLGRRDFLAMMGAGATVLFTRDLFAATAKCAPRTPNVVLIVADDLGYGDLGVYGCKDIPTPNIDAIAQRGVRFTNAYVSCPVCSPTRAGIMTGRYQERFGHWYNPGPAQNADPKFGLPLSETTLPQLLKQAGYATGMVGKWHLGYNAEFHPMQRGFDEFFGFLGGAHSYVDAQADAHNRILRGTEPVEEKEYLTEAFTREALAYIDRHQQHPFFLYLTYNAVHAPLQAPQKYLERFPKIEDTRRRTYAAMLSALDDGVGAVRQALQKAGVEDDTLIVFINDNGGPPQANASTNTPLSGAKATLLEGGIRVPLLMQWPNGIPQGKLYDRPVISLDILATSVAAAHGVLPQDRLIDGVDLMPYLHGQRRPPHKALFWAYQNGSAIRCGSWKLMKENDGKVRLFDLDHDIAESRDLAEKDPRRVKHLSAALAEWESQLKPPLWGPAARQSQQPRRRRKQP